MITDKQRREVAARMRGILRDDPHGWLDAMVVNAVTDVLGEGVTIGETVADLIDRPTCSIKREVRSGFPTTWGVCSRCGALVNAEQAVSTATEYLSTRYCPNCGAEVE